MSTNEWFKVKCFSWNKWILHSKCNSDENKNNDNHLHTIIYSKAILKQWYNLTFSVRWCLCKINQTCRFVWTILTPFRFWGPKMMQPKMTNDIGASLFFSAPIAPDRVYNPSQTVMSLFFCCPPPNPSSSVQMLPRHVSFVNNTAQWQTNWELTGHGRHKCWCSMGENGAISCHGDAEARQTSWGVGGGVSPEKNTVSF